MTERTLPLIFH